MKNPLVVLHIIKWYHFKFWQFKHLYTSVVHPAAASTFMQIVHKYTSIHTQRSEHTHAYITIKTPMTNRIINLWFLHVLQVHWHRHTHAINDMIDRCCCESCGRACVCAVRTICCVYEFYTVRTTRSLVRMLVSLLAHLFRPLFKLNSTRHNSLEPFQRKKMRMKQSLQCVAFYKFSQHVLVHSDTKLNVSILCSLFTKYSS